MSIGLIRLRAFLATALLLSGCSSTASTVRTPSVERARTVRSTGVASTGTISQPVVKGLRVAPEEKRVDLAMPVFSDPTNITNPLFPVSSQHSVLLLGRVDGLPFRTEVTLLPDSRIIEWEGQEVEVLVSQYVAFLGGRIEEVAYDLYAQADDGSVWYFGEDVFNFRDGAIADTHGTWIAGKDGPAAMIMPADPQIGDVYRPENIPGFVFEEVKVNVVGETIEGHLGPIDGALIIEELHMDGALEAKTFAPGYGEYFTAGGGDVEALDLAIPADSLSGPPSRELKILEKGWAEIFDAVGSGKWDVASRTVQKMTAAWRTYRAGDVPRRLQPRLSASLSDLADAIHERADGSARQAAIDTAQWTLDLLLRHRTQAETDLARFDLWLAQLVVDAEKGDAAAVNGDFFVLDYIRDRILHTFDGPGTTRLNTALESLGGAVGNRDLRAATRAAEKLRLAL